jgi:hypothetical protein
MVGLAGQYTVALTRWLPDVSRVANKTNRVASAMCNLDACRNVRLVTKSQFEH